ncbi:MULTISPECIES: Rieske (2Fe-2S) protein [Flavobacterium]|jgi:Rieske Fe-S protein|uniref:Rieske Fe-S protein n=3 Tax=Flavobacterium TaxID=237 RepID=A0A7W7N8L2_9FLAO|nr:MULTISPECIES: Rieske (2Fe-2S) protein [Flavobacterium]MBB4802579.1 Rieske Fe-S protein [Flavobacterium nitrogenifigens]MBB6387537.1 Rieske Fe-S protein [Flavobacterium notoginsengisoli]MBZ4040884.1 Rieske (2Fe-2S) protein [Flavobacterium hibisci]MCR4029554.1 Rieske (2Fe-2S) protein [Flavobacterium panacis]RED26945.1 Rieske Fe-S protein [Flavobacterium cutihirudinis]
MDRKQFLKACGFGCLAAISGTTILQGCSSSQISREIKESDLLVPISDFIIQKGTKSAFKKYIVIQNDILKAPICVFRFSESDYCAMFMLCTHQGAELQVFGDKLQCPAHGSEFSNRGNIETGPADTDLRKFPVTIENNILKISLK